MMEVLTAGGIGVLLGPVLKGTFILGVAGLASVVLSGSSAATRHWIWFLGMCALLVLPVAELAAPGWEVEVGTRWAPLARSGSRAAATPPAPPVAPSDAVATVTETSVSQAVTPAPARVRARTDAPRAGIAPTPRSAPATPGPATTRARPYPTPVLPRATQAQAPVAVPPAASLPGASSAIVPLVLLVWALGALGLLASLAVSLRAVARLEGRCQPFPARHLQELSDRIAARMGVRRPVRLLKGARDAMPMSWGIRRPVILLPEGAEEWQRQRLVSVLLHELAHVRRRDCLTQMVAEVALALHWFNPLAWLAARRLRVEREHACDDLVLSSGARASDYAMELLSLAQDFHALRGSALAAVAMARPVHLGPRVRALFEERRRRGLGLRASAMAAAGTVTVLLLLAGLTPVVVEDAAGLEAQVAPSPDAPPARPDVATSQRSVPPGDAPQRSAGGGEPPPPVADVEPTTPRGSGPEAPGGPAIARVDRGGLASRLLDWVLPGERGNVSRLATAAPSTLERSPIEPIERAGPQEASCGLATEGWRQTSHQSDNDDHRLRWSRPGCDVEVRVEGDVEFAADFRDVARLGRNGYVRIEEEDGGTERRLDLRPDGAGGVSYEYRVDGDQRAFDGAARGWYQAMLLQVFRRGGFMAEERVAALLRTGGVAAVLQEMEVLSADHVFATYAAELLQQADLQDAEAVGLVDRARQRVDSDHYMSEILGALATRHLDSPAVLDAFIAGSRTLESDHYRAQVLEQALSGRDLTRQQVSDLLDSASEVASDHYLAQLLRSVGARYVLDQELRAGYLRAVESIESDHYRSEVLAALLGRSELGDAELAVVVRAAGGIASDHYQSEILRQVASAGIGSGEVRATAIELAARLGSDHYRAETLKQFLAARVISEPELRLLIDAARGMGSDHYKAEILREIARNRTLDGQTRELFLDAVQSIGSSHYRGEVADVLLRQGRGGD